MRLKELLPIIDCSIVRVYEKREHRISTYIIMLNPKKNKGYISDDLLNREVDSISIGYNQSYAIRIFVREKKEEEENG